ncbi:hypothetical protein K456DRAFT_56858 [Colletotrichum gloeosporioides 23]|nr:hypothetical protein K456DRAFT_56858 [Colletotrichum gloeosporioides 23]
MPNPWAIGLFGGGSYKKNKGRSSVLPTSRGAAPFAILVKEPGTSNAISSPESNPKSSPTRQSTQLPDHQPPSSPPTKTTVVHRRSPPVRDPRKPSISRNEEARTPGVACRISLALEDSSV